MPELPTIAIVCPKNDAECWIINLSDYDPTRHVLWADRIHKEDHETKVETQKEQTVAAEEIIDLTKTARKR